MSDICVVADPRIIKEIRIIAAKSNDYCQDNLIKFETFMKSKFLF